MATKLFPILLLICGARKVHPTDHSDGECLEVAVSGSDKELPCRAQCTGVGIQWCLTNEDTFHNRIIWRLCVGGDGEVQLAATEGIGSPNPEYLSITSDNALIIHEVTAFEYHNIMATCNILDDSNTTICSSAAIKIKVIGVLDQTHPMVLAQYPPSLYGYQVKAGQSFDLCIHGRSNGISNTSGANYWEDDRHDHLNLTYYKSHCSSYSCGCSLQEAKKMNNSRIISITASYKTSPCLPYDNVFLAILHIKSLSVSDSSIYTLHFEDRYGLQLVSQIHYNISVGYEQITPVFSSEVADKQQDIIYCNVTTSVGNIVRWTGVDFISTNCTDINCICAGQNRAVSFEVYHRLVNSPYHSSATVAVHSVGLALCDMSASPRQYTCGVLEMDGAIIANNTVTVSPVSQNDDETTTTTRSNTVLLSVSISVILVTLITIIGSLVVVCFVYMRCQSKRPRNFSTRQASSNIYFYS